MDLRTFLKRYVGMNSLVRLWTKVQRGHELICESDNTEDSVCMDWELLKGVVWQSKYLDNEVMYVKDIVVDDSYIEAINIVIKE